MATPAAPIGEDTSHRSTGRTPRVCIYQNSDFVSEILQQMVELGILTSAELEQTQTRSRSKDTTTSGGLEAKGGIGVPLVGKIEVDVKGDGERTVGEGDGSDHKMRQQYIYSQAYYLHVIHRYLEEQGICKVLDTDTAEVAVGDFVEFTATFRANDVNAILDIASPELIAAIVDYRSRSNSDHIYEAGLDFDGRRAAAEKMYAQAENRANLAMAITRAVRTDFRSDETREYYGDLILKSGQMTAVTICDTDQFLVKDENRILDGTFTVLGKVCSPVAADASLFDRNKLLNRLNIEFIDGIFHKLQDTVAGMPTDNEFMDIDEDLFDARLSARIAGRSFKILPIAIYI